ncbi:hypothetical protein ACI65C_002399, partial [Semiaphis heraclei]
MRFRVRQIKNLPESLSLSFNMCAIKTPFVMNKTITRMKHGVGSSEHGHRQIYKPRGLHK